VSLSGYSVHISTAVGAGLTWLYQQDRFVDVCLGFHLLRVQDRCIVFLMSGFFRSSDGQKVCRSCRRAKHLGPQQGQSSMFRRRKGEENGWADARLLLYRTSAECSEPWRAGGARYDISFFSIAAFRQCILVAAGCGDRENVQLRAVACSQIQLYSPGFVLYCMM